MRNPALLPLSLLRMLWRHKLLVAAVWAAGTLLTILAGSRLPRSYKAEVLILVDSQEIPERYVAPTVTSAIQERLATLNQQILSATRLSKIISALDLYHAERAALAPEEVIELMRKKISVKAERGLARERAAAFRVGFEADNPNVAARVANEVANLYIQENLQFRERQASGTSQFLESQLMAAKEDLDQQEAKVSSYKLQRNGELPEQANNLNAALTRLQMELQANQDALNRTEQTKALLENTLSIAQDSLDTMTKLSAAGRAAVSSSLATVLPQQRRRPEMIREQLDGALVRYSESHPDVQALRKQYEAAVQAELSEEQAAAEALRGVGNSTHANVAPEIARDAMLHRERIEATQTQIRLAEREIKRLGQSRDRILRDIAALQGRIDRMPLREQELASLTRDYDISKENYQSLLQKKLAADMAADMERRQQSERFTVLDPATVPEKPSSPKLPLIYAGGSLFSVAFGMGLAILSDLASDVLLGEWELPADLKVLARVPRMRAAKAGSGLHG